MRAIRIFSFAVFFISGLTTLVYELTWVRLLKQIFGSDSFALSTMLTVFIGGIALGMYIAGKFIHSYCRADNNLDRRAKETFKLGQGYLLVYIYGASQLILGFYALIIPFLLGRHILGNIWSLFAGLALENFILGLVLKFIISTLLLLIPTVLIGLGFPILTELLSLEEGKISTEEIQLSISNLFATNTLGTIIGAALGGFILLPNYGVRVSIYFCALLNYAVVVATYWWFKENKEIYSTTAIQDVFLFTTSLSAKNKIVHPNQILETNEANSKYQKLISILLFISFAIGYIGLGLEVIWTKIFALIIGSSNYSLSLTLIAVLGGISLGVYSLRWVLALAHSRNISYLNLLKLSSFSFAILIVISSSLFNKLPWLFLNLSEYAEQSFLSFEMINLAKLLIIAIIALPVTFAEGIVFALILYLNSQEIKLEAEPVGARIAKVTYINTFGAILGSFTIGFIIIPLLNHLGSGLHFSLLFLIAIAFLTALLPYFIPSSKINEPAKKVSKLYDNENTEAQPSERNFNSLISPGFILTIIILILSLSFLPRLNIQEISSGVAIYKGLRYKALSKEEYRRAISEKILFHKEGLNSIVTVTENQAANAIFLKNNGKIEAGKPIREEDPSKADMPTQILLGTLPVLIQPQAQNALLIGMGSGISLKSLINAGAEIKLKKIDVCEIEALVYKAAEKFFGAPKGPIVKGIKIKRHTADARNYLLSLNSSRETVPNYDLIISQPSDPWISGSLFTKEFWQLAANNLSDNGIFVQWLQLYSIDPEYLTVALRTFASVFPEVVVFRPGNAAELIIIGSKSSIDFNCPRIKELIFKPDIKKDLAYININNDAQLLTNLILVPDSITELLDAQDLHYRKPRKANKFISKINVSDTVHKPKLTENDLNPDPRDLQVEEDIPAELQNKVSKKIWNYLSLENIFKHQTNTDDNMLLEFHTSAKLNEFSETISRNNEFLERYIDTGRIMNFLVEQNDKTLLLRLAKAHLAIDSSIHQRMAELITKYLHNINRTPASYLNLYEIYKNRSEFDKADALLYEAQSAFADFIGDDSVINKKPKKKKKEEKKAELILFEGFIGESKLDDFQLASLAQLYAYDHNWDKAFDLINRAINYNSNNQELYQIKAKILFDEYKYSNQETDASLVKAWWGEVLSKDSYNAEAYYNLAELDLLQSGNGDQSFTNDAIKNLEKSLKISPNNPNVQLTMAKIYLNQLPDKQLELIKVPKTTIDKAIKYTTNAIVLNPYSPEVNYYMADLQYKIGNVKEAYESIEKFMDECKYSSKCVDKLGTTTMDKANALEDKLAKLLSQKKASSRPKQVKKHRK